MIRCISTTSQCFNHQPFDAHPDHHSRSSFSLPISRCAHALIPRVPRSRAFSLFLFFCIPTPLFNYNNNALHCDAASGLYAPVFSLCLYNSFQMMNGERRQEEGGCRREGRG